MAFLGPSLRRTKVLDRPVRRVAVAGLISLAVNAGVLLLLGVAGAFEVPKAIDADKVELAPLSDAEWDANRTIRLPSPDGDRAPPALARPAPPTPPPEEKKAREEKQPPEEKKPRDEADPPGRLVQAAPSEDSTPPKESRFVADRDSSVAKETRSRFAGTKKFENVLPGVVEGQSRKARGDGGDAAETRAEKMGPDVPDGANADERKQPGPKEDRIARVDRPAERGPGPGLPRPSLPALRAPGDEGLGAPGLPGEPRAPSLRAGEPNLTPSAESMAALTGGPSPDDLRAMDLEEGDETRLNTRFFRYATFYNRVYSGIYEQWDPNEAYRKRDPELKTYPLRDRTTVFALTLDPAGEIRSVELVQSCGLDFLDRELLRAVKAAGRFPNVPPSLVKDGVVKIPPVGFTLVMDPKHRPRVYFQRWP